MKPQSHIVLPVRGKLLPPRGSHARLPFLLMPVLAGMAVVQLAWPERIELPPGGSVARVGLAPLADAPLAVIVPPLLANRDLFAPPTGPGGPDNAGDPLGGAVIAGVVQKGRLRLGVVQQPGGQLRYVGVGGAIAGWRLAALDRGEARLTRGPKTLHAQALRVTYGMHAAQPTNTSFPRMAQAGFPQTIESGR